MKLDLGIKPYYSTDLGDLYNADCLDLLPKIPDKTVDLVITDIPFNVNWKYEGSGYNDNLTDDEYTANMQKWFTAMDKVAKRTVVKIPTKFSFLCLPVFNECCGYKWTVIQYSPNTTGHGAFNLHLYTQYIVSKGEGKTPQVDLFINTKNNIDTEHPAEMPTTPIKKLLGFFSEEQAIIIDPFLGSGTTALACESLNRRWIGIEISEKYCEIASKRIHNMDRNLF